MQVNTDDHVLVFNSGSSSLKFQLFETGGEAPVSTLWGVVRHLGDNAVCEWRYGGRQERTALSAKDHAAAARHVLTLLEQTPGMDSSLLDDVAAVGHRIVHGGDRFFEPTLLTKGTLAALDKMSELAPLHNPPALSVVRSCREQFPDIPMAGVFDTAFFHALPEYVCSYAVPARWATGPQPIRRYGFHGLAHRYMAERLSAAHAAGEAPGRVITLQLGHGCSVAAIRDGSAVETSMGFTPLEGLIMATRPGDIDAGVLLYLLEQGGVSATELQDGLNHRAGLLGLSGASADMQELLALEAQGHAGAQLAVEGFCHRARKYLGAYLAVLGGADAIVFGGGIGEHAATIRARICDGMQWCGLHLDDRSNRSAEGEETRISAVDSPVAAYVIAVDEESLVARDTLRALSPAHTPLKQDSH